MTTEETRTIRLEVEVPVLPEQAWQAIATGPGITAWFVPTAVDEREGGVVSQHFGPGMDVTGEVMAWEAGRRFLYGEPGGEGLAFEFSVEAVGSGASVVRLANTGFSASSDADAEYDAMGGGWRMFFEVLRQYLSRFPGQACTPVLTMGGDAGTRQEAWEKLTTSLGISSPTVGQRVEVRGEGLAPLSGEISWLAPAMCTMVLDQPTTGIALLAAEGQDGGVGISVWLYFYGAGAPAAAAEAEPAWQHWMTEHFPMPEEA